MKITTLAQSHFKPGMLRLATRAGFLSALLSAATICPLTVKAADNDDARVTVRSSVEQAYTQFSKEPIRDHGKQYAIVAVEALKDVPLTKPMNETALLKQLHAVLLAYGFHESAPGTNPDIVLTVLYGRSTLRNPYLDKTAEVSGDNSSSADFGGAAVSASADQILRERSTPGYKDKVISAAAEKLMIAVTAWKFPATKDEKPRQYWRTVMLVDDSEQDLNRFSQKMVAAGGAYFDHPMKREEVVLDGTEAEQNVRLMLQQVLTPKK